MPGASQIKGGPRKTEVRAALARVLASVPFRSSKRLQHLLTFLVEEVLAGRGESLVQYRVATEGLGLGDQFDPEKSTLVRVHARRLRKALAAYYEGEGIADEIAITLPASGYHVGFVRVGSGPGRAGKTPGRAPLVVISNFQGIGLKGPWADIPASFVEELALRLGRSTHLRIARGLHTARRPDVDFTIEGSIERRGEKLLVRARLLDAPGSIQIWTRRHEYSSQKWDAAQFEEEIVEAIAVEVGSDFGKIDRHLLRRSDPSADAPVSLESALLKVKAYEASYSKEAHAEAILALRGVLAESPAETAVHANLGLMLLIGHCEYFARRDPFPAEALGHLAIARAAEPNHAFVRYGRVVALLLRREYAELRTTAAEILADPNFPPGLAIFIALCQFYSRTAEASTRNRITSLMQFNPDYPRIIHSAFALEHLLEGDHRSALQEADAWAIPNYWFDPVLRIAIHHAAGRRKEAKAERKKLLALCPDYGRHGAGVLSRSLHPDFVDLLMRAWRAAV